MDELVVASGLDRFLKPRDLEVMRLLERGEDWEKLVVWLVVVWSFIPDFTMPESESIEGIEQVTLKLLLQQPSALPRFENLCTADTLKFYVPYRARLQQVCKQVRVEVEREQSPSEGSSPRSKPVCTQLHAPLPFMGDDSF